MGQMKRIYQDLQEREQLLERLENTDEELQTLDFDTRSPTISDDKDWWRDQDTEMGREELEAIESLAELTSYRTQGYGL
jgi:hypothetical protein